MEISSQHNSINWQLEVDAIQKCVYNFFYFLFPPIHTEEYWKYIIYRHAYRIYKVIEYKL